MTFWHFHVRKWRGFILHLKCAPNILSISLCIIHMSCNFFILDHFKNLHKGIHIRRAHKHANLLSKTIHNVWLQQIGKKVCVCTISLLMTMSKLSSKVHCTWSIWRVVDLDKVKIGTNFVCVEWTNLTTYYKW